MPIVAGPDVFANLLTAWPDYPTAAISGLLPAEAQVFMYVVGVIEVGSGFLVLSRYTEYGGYLVAGWLSTTVMALHVSAYYDVVVRDLVMAVGAVALAQLVAASETA